MGELAAFLGIAIVVIVTPGQDTALTIRNALLGGPRGGVPTALGVVAGSACWTVAASAGLAALLVASEPVFVALKLAGAAYLVYLGLQALRRAVHPFAYRSTARRSPLAPHRAYQQGLLSNLGNPKIAVFFTSLLPQFGSSFWSMLALGLLFCSLGAHLAVRLLPRRRPRRRPAAAPADPPVARRSHRDAPRGVRDPAGRGALMNVAVIGRGNVGGGLAKRWRRSGHDVTEIGSDGGDASGADVLVIAVPAAVIGSALQNVAGIAGKATIDATNAWGGRDEAFPSLAHKVKSIVGGPTAKAFNLNFANIYERIDEQRARPANLYAADAEAREVTEQLSRDAGYDPVCAGGLENARLLEDHLALISAISRAGAGPFFYRIAPPGEL